MNYNGFAGGLNAVPYAQGYASAGYRTRRGSLTLGATYYGANNTYFVPAFVVLDAQAIYQFDRQTSIAVTAGNIGNVNSGAIASFTQYRYLSPQVSGSPSNNSLRKSGGTTHARRYTQAPHQSIVTEMSLVSAESRLAFETDGYVHFRDVFSRIEMARVEALFERSFLRAGRTTEPPAGEAYGVGPLTDLGETYFLELFDDDRLSGLAEALLGEDCVFPNMSSANVFAKTSPWHHDGSASNTFRDLKITLYLEPLDENEGCLTVIPGSHAGSQWDELERSIAAGTFNVHDRYARGALAVPSRLGDVTCFHRSLYHSTWGATGRRRQPHFNFLGRPKAINDAWVSHARQYAEINGLWRRGFRLFSEAFVATAGTRRMAKIQPFLDWGYYSETRVAATPQDVFASWP